MKVAFRYNEINEQRMSQELLSELRSTLNKKCVTLRGPLAGPCPGLEASVLVTNVGSHDRPDMISDGGHRGSVERLRGTPNPIRMSRIVSPLFGHGRPFPASRRSRAAAEKRQYLGRPDVGL